MNLAESEDFITNILKPCFPRAHNMKILKNLTVDDLCNFTSDIQQLTIEYEEDEVMQRKNLILKVPEHSLAHAFFAKINFYDKEACMYKEMASHINDILEDKILPIHYGTTDTQILILEDLMAHGFSRVDKDPFLSLEQCYPILKALAKFHAASHEIHKLYPHLLNHVHVIRFRSIDMRRPMVRDWEPILCQLLRQNNLSHLIPKLAAAMLFLREDDAGLNSKVHRKNFKFVTLNHCDCRKENMLFKFDKMGRIKHIKIFDFQTVMWSSPVFDFFYFIMHSIPPDIFDQHFDTLVDSYLHSLNEALLMLNSSDTYTKEDFMADLRNLRVVLFFTLICYCVYLAAPNTKQCQEMFSTEKVEHRPSFDSLLDNELFVRVISGWLKYLEKIGAYD